MEIIKKYPIWSAIAIGVLFVFVAKFVSELYFFEDYDLWSLIDAYATSLTLFLVFYSWKQNKKQMETIKIFIEFINENGANNQIAIDSIKRKNFSRSELKGILRELHNSKEPYEIDYMSKSEFLDNIFSIQEGVGDEFFIKISNNDIFNFKREQQ